MSTGETEGEESAAVAAAREEALEALAQPDAILEASVFDAIQKFIKNKGSPGKLVVQLADSYHGYPQMAELIRSWLEMSGMPESEIGDLLKDYALAWVKQRFDAKVVDEMITQRRQTSRSLSWLKALIDGLSEEKDWRQLIYDLSEGVETETFFLDLAVKTMVERGFFEEVATCRSIERQQEIYSLVLAHCLTAILKAKTASERLHFTRLLCAIGSISKAVYIYTQAVLRFLLTHLLQQQHDTAMDEGNDDDDDDDDDGNGDGSGRDQRKEKEREMRRRAVVVVGNLADALEDHVARDGHAVRDVGFLLSATTTEPEVARMARMLHVGQMTMADVDALHRLYTSDDTPPVSYLQSRGMLEMLTREVFVGTTNNEKHALQCRYLLALATCVRSDESVTQDTHDKITATLETLENVFSLLLPVTKNSWPTLSQHIHLPVVGHGLVLFIDRILCDAAFFLNFVPSSPPLCLMLLEQIAVQHVGLRRHVMDVLTRALEFKYSLDALTQSHVQRMLIGRLVYLLSLGFALPVLEYIDRKQTELDTSLVVLFVLEIVEHIQGPFSPEFAHHMASIMGQQRTIVGLQTKGERVPACRFFIKGLIATRGLHTDDTAALRKVLATLT